MLTSSLTNIDDDWGNIRKKKMYMGRKNMEKERNKKKKIIDGNIVNELAFADDYVGNSFWYILGKVISVLII